jgi:hypothetical protein
MGEIVPKSDAAYQYFEKLDEQSVRDEVQGIWAKTLVYQFKEKGRTVTGLSIRGVEEAARFLVRHGYDIVCDKAVVEETNTEYRSSCKVTYTVPNGRQMVTYGYSRTLKAYSNGSSNEFAYIQALSKAQRNALRTVIPEKIMSTLIERFLRDTDKVKQVEENNIPEKTSAPLPPKPQGLVRFICDAPRFGGTDLKEYGPFDVEDIANLPLEDAKKMVDQKFAIYVETEPPQTTTSSTPSPTPVDRGDLKKTIDIVYGNAKRGVIELYSNQIMISFVPPLPADASVIDNFLIARIIDPLVEKTRGEDKILEFQTIEDGVDMTGLSILGDVTEKMATELAPPCGWTATKAIDNKTKQ